MFQSFDDAFDPTKLYLVSDETFLFLQTRGIETCARARPHTLTSRKQRNAELEQFRKQQAMLRSSPAAAGAAAALKAKAAAKKAAAS